MIRGIRLLEICYIKKKKNLRNLLSLSIDIPSLELVSPEESLKLN